MFEWLKLLRRVAAVVGGAGAALLITASASAQDTDEDGPGGFLVLGAAAVPEFEGSDDFRAVPLIVSRFSAFGVDTEIEGLEARFDVLGDPVWRAGPAIGVTLPRNDSFTNQAQIAALDDVDLALELGGFVGFEMPFGDVPEGRLSGAVVTDAGSENQYFFGVGAFYRF